MKTTLGIPPSNLEAGMLIDGEIVKASDYLLIKELLGLCIKDLYSSTGKFKKKTAIEIMKYVSDNNINVD